MTDIASDRELELLRKIEALVIERHELTAKVERLRAAIGAVQDWLDTLPNAASIPGFPKDAIDAAMLINQQLGSKE